MAAEPPLQLGSDEQTAIERIVRFLRDIGLPPVFATIDEPSVLPGIRVDDGRMVVDLNALAYPGDLLHEAGHLAVMSPGHRRSARGAFGASQGAEIAAQAWSYAAALRIGLDAAVVFHEAGYQGAAEALRAAFAGPGAPGAPLLTWLGLGSDAYPTMLRWLNETEREP